MSFKRSLREFCPVSICFTKTGETRLLRCGKWSCPHCAKLLSKRWAKRVYQHIQEQQTVTAENPLADTKQFWFMTFTLKGKRLTTERAYVLIKKIWGKFRKQMQRKYREWQYVAFVEGQPKRQNMPHFHVISDCQPPARRNKHGIITKRAMHDYAHSLGFGYQADLSQVSGRKAAFYVAKYVSKQGTSVPKNFRRVRTSQDWLKLPENPERKYIVKSRGEGMGSFVSRVATETGLSEADVYTRFAVAWAENHKDLPPFPRKW